jgi:uroporphyrinogen-III synthase
MQGLRLIVTRPEEDAIGLADKLAVLGHECAIVPLIRIVPRRETNLPDMAWQAVCTTSANALRCRDYSAAIKALPLLTVGPQSLTEARRCGFSRASAHGGDVHGLCKYIAKHYSPDSGPMLYLSGAETSADLASALRALGFSVHREIVYDAQAQVPDDFVLHLEQADGVLLYSPRTAIHWLSAIQSTDLVERAATLTHFCLSANVAAKLPREFKRKVAATPNENGMLGLLDMRTD